MVSRAGLVAVAVLGGCAVEPNPEFYRERFAFAVVSDWYGDAAVLDRVFCEVRARPDVELVFGTGDLHPPLAVADALAATRREDCGMGELAWFPARGEVELGDPASMQAWNDAWWSDAPEASPLAAQIDVRRFEAGPSAVPGSAYAFEHRGATFVVLDTFDGAAPGIAPGSAQLEWLREHASTDPSRPTFAFGHVALAPACYREEEPCNWPACPAEQSLPWDSDILDPATAELARTLAEGGAVAYFHGHDNLPGRRLLDASRGVLYERLTYDIYDECTDMVRPLPDDAAWADLQAAPDRVWQVDAGAIGSEFATYVVTTVTPEGVDFEVFALIMQNATVLVDKWTVPR